MSLYKQQNSTLYWYKFKYKGKVYRKPTGEAGKRAALQASRRIYTEIVTADEKPELPSIEQLRDWDLESRAKARVSERMLTETYPIYWRHILGFFKKTEDVTYDSVQAYVAHRKAHRIAGKRPPANQSIKRELWALRRGGREAKNRKNITLDWGFDWPILEADESLVSQSARDWDDIGPLVNFILELRGEAQAEILLCLLTGMRAGELARCETHVMEKGEVLEDYRGLLSKVGDTTLLLVPEKKKRSKKRTKPRRVAMPPFALALYKKWCPMSGQDHKRARQLAARRAGITDHLHAPHRRDMRSQYATTAEGEGLSRFAINATLGHGAGVEGKYTKQIASQLLAIGMAVQRFWLGHLTEKVGKGGIVGGIVLSKYL